VDDHAGLKLLVEVERSVTDVKGLESMLDDATCGISTTQEEDEVAMVVVSLPGVEDKAKADSDANEDVISLRALIVGSAIAEFSELLVSDEGIDSTLNDPWLSVDIDRTDSRSELVGMLLLGPETGIDRLVTAVYSDAVL
jgi:hypothetical protein